MGFQCLNQQRLGKTSKGRNQRCQIGEDRGDGKIDISATWCTFLIIFQQNYYYQSHPLSVIGWGNEFVPSWVAGNQGPQLAILKFKPCIAIKFLEVWANPNVVPRILGAVSQRMGCFRAWGVEGGVRRNWKAKNKNKLIKILDNVYNQMFFDQVPREAIEKALLGDFDNQILQFSPKRRFSRFNEIIQQTHPITSYKGYDVQSGREVAWNTMDFSRSTLVQTEHFIRIVKSMKQMRHENIVKYVDSWVCKTKKEFVFITELMNGGSLKQHLKRIGRPKLKIVKGWCNDIFKALSHIHENHPDSDVTLQCSNIYINSNTNQIKLGYQCFVSTQLSIRNALSIPWLAPEMAYNQTNSSNEVYSFGMALLEMITGKQPYSECRNYLEIARNIVWKVKPLGIQKIGNVQLRSIIRSCTAQKTERVGFKQLAEMAFWKIESADNACVEVIQNKEEHTIKSSNFSLTKTVQLSNKPSHNSNKTIDNQYEAVFNYKTEMNKNFQIKIMSCENERPEFQDFVLFLISKIESRETHPQAKCNKQTQSIENLQIVNNMRNIFVQKYKEYSTLIENILAESSMLQAILIKKIQMEQKEMQILQKELECRVLEKSIKNKKNPSFGLDLFDIINFNMNTIQVKQLKKGLSTASDILNLSCSSIYPENKSEKSQDFEFDLEKMNIINNKGLMEHIPGEFQDQKHKSYSSGVPAQKKSPLQNRSHKVGVSFQNHIQYKV